ncbi:MAG: hypothetical protein AAFV07_20440, partial [Bacteroidota bacterium]
VIRASRNPPQPSFGSSRAGGDFSLWKDKRVIRASRNPPQPSFGSSRAGGDFSLWEGERVIPASRNPPQPLLAPLELVRISVCGKTSA